MSGTQGSEDGPTKRNICRNPKETARRAQRKPGMEAGEMAQGTRVFMLTQEDLNVNPKTHIENLSWLHPGTPHLEPQCLGNGDRRKSGAYWLPVHLQVSERPCLTGIMWRAKEQDTQYPPWPLYMYTGTHTPLLTHGREGGRKGRREPRKKVPET